MSADLTPYRGKRALVCGLPKDTALTWMEWSQAVRSVLDIIVPLTERCYSGHAPESAIRASNAQVVLVCEGSRYGPAMRLAAKAAGVPVLRVRRDGTVEVDDG